MAFVTISVGYALYGLIRSEWHLADERIIRDISLSDKCTAAGGNLYKAKDNKAFCIKNEILIKID